MPTLSAFSDLCLFVKKSSSGPHCPLIDSSVGFVGMGIELALPWVDMRSANMVLG